MNDIVASLACAAMNHLDKALAFRETIGRKYRDELRGLDKIQLMNYKEDRKPNYQIFPVHVKNREEFGSDFVLCVSEETSASCWSDGVGVLKSFSKPTIQHNPTSL